MASRLKRLAPDWLTLLSGILIVLAFPPWNLYPLIGFALVPWFIALKRAASMRRAFIEGVWLSVFMSLGGFYWVAHVLQEFGNLPLVAALALLALFSLLGQPQFPLFALLWRWIRVELRRTQGGWTALLVALLLALAYAGIDWILPKMFVDTFGHSFYLAKHLRQAADLGGATLLTFAIFLLNEAIYGLWTEIGARREPSLWPALKVAGPPAIQAFALMAGLWTYGYFRYQTVVEAETHPTSVLQAAVIQANIGDFDKIASERGVSGAADRVLDTFFRMSDDALKHEPRPEVIIWPETSYPSTFRTPTNAEEMDRDRRVEAFAQSRKVHLLFGGYDHFKDKDYNAFFFLSPEPHPGVAGPGDLQIYRKNMLLMFGEYIPGAETFDFIKTSFPQVGNFGRGAGPSVFGVQAAPGKTVQIAPIICYEALFPNYIIEGARKGSQMILNITNDSWFGESGEPILHLSLTTFRGLEARLPQLRATNTGISTLILPDGEITQATAIGSQQILYASVPILAPMPTLMKAWGDWFGWAALAASLLGFGGLLALSPKGARAVAPQAALARAKTTHPGRVTNS